MMVDDQIANAALKSVNVSVGFSTCLYRVYECWFVPAVSEGVGKQTLELNDVTCYDDRLRPSRVQGKPFSIWVAMQARMS